MWLASAMIGVVRVLVGASARWSGSEPSPAQRIYFANHSSHIDTVALWAALPPDLRARTRPVAAADYWNRGGLRGYIATRALNAVFVERRREERAGDPLAPLVEALEQGDSLILFPEGTRNTEALPGPFKAGLFHLATRFPEVELVPVYLENLHRIMPKGTFLPVPLVCTVRFGPAFRWSAAEGKDSFLSRARQAIVELS